MRDRLRSHLTYANAMATVAVFLALSGGTAVALNGSNTVFSDDIVDGQVKAPDVAANAVNGSDVVNGSIAGADIAASALPKGRSVTSSCNPTGTNSFDCGSLTVNLPRAGLRVLVVASANWYDGAPQFPPSGTGVTRGTCRIGVNGAPFGPDATPGEIQDTTYSGAQQSVTLTAVTDPNLGAGNHTIGLACNEIAGDIRFGPTYVSTVVLGPG